MSEPEPFFVTVKLTRGQAQTLLEAIATWISFVDATPRSAGGPDLNLRTVHETIRKALERGE